MPLNYCPRPSLPGPAHLRSRSNPASIWEKTSKVPSPSGCRATRLFSKSIVCKRRGRPLSAAGLHQPPATPEALPKEGAPPWPTGEATSRVQTPLDTCISDLLGPLSPSLGIYLGTNAIDWFQGKSPRGRRLPGVHPPPSPCLTEAFANTISTVMKSRISGSGWASTSLPRVCVLSQLYIQTTLLIS